MFGLVLAILALIILVLRPRQCEAFTPWDGNPNFGQWRNFNARYSEQDDDYQEPVMTLMFV